MFFVMAQTSIRSRYQIKYQCLVSWHRRVSDQVSLFLHKANITRSTQRHIITQIRFPSHLQYQVILSYQCQSSISWQVIKSTYIAHKAHKFSVKHIQCYVLLTLALFACSFVVFVPTTQCITRRDLSQPNCTMIWQFSLHGLNATLSYAKQIIMQLSQENSLLSNYIVFAFSCRFQLYFTRSRYMQIHYLIEDMSINISKCILAFILINFKFKSKLQT